MDRTKLRETITNILQKSIDLRGQEYIVEELVKAIMRLSAPTESWPLDVKILTKTTTKNTFQKTPDDRFGKYLDILAEGQAKHKPYVDIVERLSAGLHLNFPPYGTSKDVDHVAHMIALAEADHPDQTVEKFCEWATATKDAKELSWYRIKVDGIWGDWLLPYMPERNGKGKGNSHKPDYTQDPDLYYLQANKNGAQRADSIARLEAQGMIEKAKAYLKPQELESLYVHTPA